MLIPASRFSTLPEGCPVRWGGTRWDSATVQLGGAIALRRQGRKGVDTRIVSPEHVQVDLCTPAAIRAFAPALILAVRFPEGRRNDTKYPPQPLRDVAHDNYVLIGYILDSGFPCAYMPRHELVTGDTPEECLLNGLKAALEAAMPGRAA